MEPTDLTVRILQEIRDEVRETNAEVRALREDTNRRFEDLNARFAEMNVRFEVIETTLRDLAQQLVIIGRGVKVAIEHRSATDERIEDLARRVSELEKRAS